MSELGKALAVFFRYGKLYGFKGPPRSGRLFRVKRPVVVSVIIATKVPESK